MSAERRRLETLCAPAMGARLHITADASPIAMSAARIVVATLEARWSRFLDTSEVSALNRHRGPAIVRPSTARIIEVALAGRDLTGGWFDPLVGADVCSAGYRKTFSDGWATPSDPALRKPKGAPVVDADLGLVELPEDKTLDLGGIGKGWAADAAATLLFERGAVHVGVEIGGDIRIRSHNRAVVDIEAPTALACATPRPASASTMRVGLRDGGVAVSGPTKRNGHGRHHLIDPFTGRPAARPRIAAVIAASAAGAEMLATAAAIAPLADAVSFLEQAGATAWLIEANGDLTEVGQPDLFLLDDGWLREPSRREWAM